MPLLKRAEARTFPSSISLIIAGTLHFVLRVAISKRHSPGRADAFRALSHFGEECLKHWPMEAFPLPVTSPLVRLKNTRALKLLKHR